jgi:hypothetical protein
MPGAPRSAEVKAALGRHGRDQRSKKRKKNPRVFFYLIRKVSVCMPMFCEDFFGTTNWPAQPFLTSIFLGLVPQNKFFFLAPCPKVHNAGARLQCLANQIDEEGTINFPYLGNERVPRSGTQPFSFIKYSAISCAPHITASLSISDVTLTRSASFLRLPVLRSSGGVSGGSTSKRTRERSRRLMAIRTASASLRRGDAPWSSRKRTRGTAPADTARASG